MRTSWTGIVARTSGHPWSCAPRRRFACGTGASRHDERSAETVHQLLMASVPVPYPSYLNTGDNTWQITAATFVGLMSLPGLAVLYASIVPKKWATNVLAMMFAGFSLVLVVWVLWGYKMGFGATSIGGGVRNGVQTQLSGVGGIRHFFDNFVGKPGQILNAPSEQGQACQRRQHGGPLPLPDRHAGVLPVRVRRDHAAAVPRQRPRTDQVPAPGVCSSRCGRRSSTASTRSSCGVAATSPKRGRSTSRVASSSTCPLGCRGSSRPGCSVRGC